MQYYENSFLNLWDLSIWVYDMMKQARMLLIDRGSLQGDIMASAKWKSIIFYYHVNLSNYFAYSGIENELESITNIVHS